MPERDSHPAFYDGRRHNLRPDRHIAPDDLSRNGRLFVGELHANGRSYSLPRLLDRTRSMDRCATRSMWVAPFRSIQTFPSGLIATDQIVRKNRGAIGVR